MRNRDALASITHSRRLRLHGMRDDDRRSRDDRRIRLVHPDSLVDWEVSRPEESLNRMSPDDGSNEVTMFGNSSGHLHHFTLHPQLFRCLKDDALRRLLIIGLSIIMPSARRLCFS